MAGEWDAFAIDAQLLSSNRFLSICLWFAPDAVMLLSNIIAFVVLRKINAPPADDPEEAETTASSSAVAVGDEHDEVTFSAHNYLILKRTAVFVALATLLIAATLQPSIPSGIYFVVFLIAGNTIAMYKELGRGFAILCRLLLFVLSVHIFALLAYQTPYPQEMFDVNSTIIR